MSLIDLSNRVATLAAPCRVTDALVMRALLGLRIQPAAVTVLMDQPSQPLCLHRSDAIPEAQLERMRSTHDEILNFQVDDEWLLFVSRVTLPLTSSIDAAVSLTKRALPEISEVEWDVSSNGFARIRYNGEIFTGNSFNAAASLVSVVLGVKQYFLSIGHER